MTAIPGLLVQTMAFVAQQSRRFFGAAAGKNAQGRQVELLEAIACRQAVLEAIYAALEAEGLGDLMEDL